MKDTLLFLVTQLVDTPDSVRVDEDKDQEKTVLTLHVSQSDMGKVIGKSGRIIRALRDLIKILAAKRNEYVDVVLAEDVRNEPEVAEATEVSEGTDVSEATEVS